MTADSLEPAGHRILREWLQQLEAALPTSARHRTRIIDELDDGLHTAVEHHLRAGVDSVEAARLALAEFGDPVTVATSFRDELTAHLTRRVGVVLLVSGPLVGVAWLAALVPPLWPPRPADLLSTHPLYLIVLATAVPAALLAIATTGPLGRQLRHHASYASRVVALIAASACVVGDSLLLSALVVTALSPSDELTLPTALLACSASAARLGLAAYAARRCLACQVSAH